MKQFSTATIDSELEAFEAAENAVSSANELLRVLGLGKANTLVEDVPNVIKESTPLSETNGIPHLEEVSGIAELR